MQLPFLKYAAVAALAAGMVYAQAPTNQSQTAPKTRQGRRGMMRRHLARIAQTLNLTDAQKQQAHTILQQARQSAQPVRQELRQTREALTAAAKEGKSDAEIQKLSNEQGRLRG